MSNWLTYSPTSGVGNGTITITAETLSELEDRVATLVAKNPAHSYLSATTVVTQTAYNPTGLTDYFTFNIISGGTINWKANDTTYVKTISYSKDSGVTWTDLTATTEGTSFNVNAGDKVLFKGDNDTYGSGTTGGIEYNTFSGSTAGFELEGNIMSLIDSTNFATVKTLTSAYTFYRLFMGCTGLTSAENLVLPATTLVDDCYCYMFADCSSLTTAPSILPATKLAQYCYLYMFYNCASLTIAPVLPATVLTNYCYDCMFYGCTSLTTAPSLPAITLANYCYFNMFYGCTGLTTTPSILPATTLAPHCYNQMFYNCSSLTTAPELPATTLAENCYRSMFYNCTSLSYIKCIATDISATNCTQSWVNGVPSTGTFVKNPNMFYWTTGVSGIPSGWTVIDAT